jgi:hypothetical protein
MIAYREDGAVLVIEDGVVLMTLVPENKAEIVAALEGIKT